LPGPEHDDPTTTQRLTANLQFLSELAQVVAAHTELQSILDWIVQRTARLMSADAGSIKLLGPGDGAPLAQTRASTRKAAGLESGSWPRMVTMSVMGHLMLHPGPLSSPDLFDDPRFGSLKGMPGPFRAVLAVPLRVGDAITGLLAVTRNQPGVAWTGEQVAMLAIVASSSASVVEQARLRIEAQEKQRLELENRQLEAERRRIERELETARDIQMSLVPDGPLCVGAWEVLGRVVPARQVGGDAFDYFALDGGRLAIAIADVAGKGVPAAILMGSVQAKIRAFCNGVTPLDAAIASVNRSVAARVPAGKFVTLFYAELDTGAGVLRFCNAGHNPPLLRRRDGTLEPLHTGGLPLGLFADAGYAAGETGFGPGDALLLYSDGITEAFDAHDEEFGDDRLAAWWGATGGGRAAIAVEALIAEVAAFRGPAAQSDDITAVVVTGAS
jgi:sigma-B regulation protein RsbU (phosphoserine phosphatase)